MDRERRQILFRRLRRILRIVGVVVGSTVALLLLLVAAVILSPPGRRALLDKGLGLAAEALPGQLTVAQADWPELGRLEFTGVVWTDGPDTLARADTLRVQVDISDLVARDVTVRRLLAAGLAADVPAIMERLPAAPVDTTDTAQPTPPGGPPPFPRAGCVPPLPSVSVERLSIRRVAVLAAPDHLVELDSLSVALELRRDRIPRIDVALRGRPLPELGVAWRLGGGGNRDTLTLDVSPLTIQSTAELPDPGALPLSGHLVLPVAMIDSLMAGRVPAFPSLELRQLDIAGETGDWRLDARLDGRRPGHVLVESSLPDAPRNLLEALAAAGADTLAPGLLDTLDARWGRDTEPGLRLRIDLEPPPEPETLLGSRMIVDGDLRLPSVAAFEPLLPAKLRTEKLGPILAVLNLRYDGQARPPTFAARIDLGRTEWIETALIVASGDTTVARLDSLVVRLPGVALAGTGAVDRDSLRVTLDVNIRDGSLLDHWRDPVLGDLDPRAGFRLEAVSAWPLPPLDVPTAFDTADPLAMIPFVPARVVFTGDLHLPPPAKLGSLLPPQLVVDDLGPSHLTMDLRYDGLAATPGFATRIDVDEADWLDAFHLVAAGDPNSVRLDSVLVRMPGLSLAASGAADRDSVRVKMQFDLPDSTLLLRWRDPALAGVHPRARVALDAAGAWPLPRFDVVADLALTTPRITIPAVSLAAVASLDTLTLDLDLPQGVSTIDRSLKSASLRFDGAADDSLHWLRGDLRADVEGPRAGLLLDARVDARDLLGEPRGTVVGDTLRFHLAERAITNRAPWNIAFDLADSLIEITDLELVGELGQISLDAWANPDSLDAEVTLALSLALEALSTLLPPATVALLPQGSVTASGQLSVSGTVAAPWAGGRVNVAFTDNAELAGLDLDTHVAIGGRGAPPTGVDIGRASWREHSARIDLVLSEAGAALLHVSALSPLPRPDASADSVDVRLDATGMDLARLAPLLPRGISLTGRLDADTRIAGIMAPDQKDPDLAISGGIRLSDLRMGAPDGSWMAMTGEVDLSGTSLAPVVAGGLDIHGGLIRIPEPPPSLLPEGGEAMLWQAAAAAPDSLAGAAADTAQTGPTLPSFVPELTFAIRCPGALWLRGQGLDVELSGDLNLLLRDGRPAIAGELKARQGTMKQLGRVFTLDRGRIIFYADEDELNPELDLALGVRVNSYQITIALTGTANEPKLEFSSSPDLGDGDIVSVLLFGKTSDELDEGQSGLMAERAAQVALAYGSVQLQENLARELGVDVLSIAPQTGDSEKTSLTVGKYLSTKVMVRYEQVLSEDSAFYVHLDYNLTTNQEWKLHTQVSQGEASGVEIKWEKEW